MNKKLLLCAVLFIALVFTSVNFASAATYERNTGPEYQGLPLNFQDYPDAFDQTSGLMTWDLDIIDIDQLQLAHPEITGEGVYVAVLDTGLKKNWRDYFPEERIKTEWGRSFVDVGVMQAEKTGKYTPNIRESHDFTGDHPHGTHVTSTIIGYGFYGTPIQGVAPHATIIPVKVLEYFSGIKATFGTDHMIAAGINYITELALAHPESRFVISMSLGSLSQISEIEAEAVDNAITAGVVIVAAAGNYGTAGMDSPGSYAPVISVGATGWASWTPYYGYWGEWAMSGWWYQDVPEDNAYVSYITDFSGRDNPALGWDQELDIVAPGSWVVGPYPVGPGQSHLPWWSNGNGNGVGGQYYYIGGTSMATPHVSGVVALMLQANPDLTPGEVEAALRASTDVLPFAGGQYVWDPNAGAWNYVTWGFDGLDAVGYGLLQADAAVTYVI
ncbi:MAG: S8 family serine peptidase [Candidatus Hodarchaeota archaeon]